MKRFFYLIEKDARLVLRSTSLYLMLIVTSLIIGNSFLLAVDLYSKASIAALNDPFYAKSFEPVAGVFNPTMGGFYLTFSMIFPFVVIPLISKERENSTISVLYQVGYSPVQIVLSKWLLSFMAVLFALALVLPGVVAWLVWGGHVPGPEFLLLMLGYLLYGSLVSGISIFTASVTRNSSSAAIIALGIILFSWIVDFTSGMISSPVIKVVSQLSLSKFISVFEKGIFDPGTIFTMLAITVFLIFVAATVLTPGKSLKDIIVPAAVVGFMSVLIAGFNPGKIDITESHRNSFPPAVSRNLRKIGKIRIKIYMSPEDSRYRDFETEFLSRLKMVKRDVEIELMRGDELEKQYGIIKYELISDSGIKSDSTYSNSVEEAFQILSGLSGLKFNIQEDLYPGYPIVVNRNQLFPVKILYFLLFPLVFTFLLIYTRIRE